MKALVLRQPGLIEIGEVSAPSMADDRVLLSVDACTICGGDLKVYTGHRSSDYPRFIRGHEYSGRVVEVGRSVRGFRVGDRVAHVFEPFCGTCPACRTGHANFCQSKPRGSAGPSGGGFAEFVSFSVPDLGSGHFVIPEEIDTLDAALAEPATCAIGAVLRARISPGAIVAVIGLGGLGQMVAQVVTGSGGRTIGIDVHQAKVELAKEWCEWTIDASSTDVLEAVRDFTEGIGADVVLEVVGRPQTLEQAFEMVRLGGRVVFVGVHVSPVPNFHPEWVFRKDLEVIGAKGPHPLVNTQGLPLAFDFMKRGIIKTKPLLKSFPLDCAQQAFDAQLRGGVPKAAICPHI